MCGDLKCTSTKEAQKYFDDNLSLEIIIIDKKNKKSFDLVKLNTGSSDKIDQSSDNKEGLLDIFKGNENISKKNSKINQSSDIKEKRGGLLDIFKSNENISKNNDKIKITDDKDIKDIKIVNKPLIDIEDLNINDKKIKENIIDKSIIEDDSTYIRKETVYKNKICQIIVKCDIDEISNYLLKNSKKKDFPNLAVKN